jgi:hypothetical protein
MYCQFRGGEALSRFGVSKYLRVGRLGSYSIMLVRMTII